MTPPSPHQITRLHARLAPTATTTRGIARALTGDYPVRIKDDVCAAVVGVIRVLHDHGALTISDTFTPTNWLRDSYFTPDCIHVDAVACDTDGDDGPRVFFAASARYQSDSAGLVPILTHRAHWDALALTTSNITTTDMQCIPYVSYDILTGPGHHTDRVRPSSSWADLFFTSRDIDTECVITEPARTPKPVIDFGCPAETVAWSDPVYTAAYRPFGDDMDYDLTYGQLYTSTATITRAPGWHWYGDRDKGLPNPRARRERARSQRLRRTQ